MPQAGIFPWSRPMPHNHSAIGQGGRISYVDALNNKPVVDVRDTQRYHCKYIINQYLAGQSCFVRYSSSIKWVFRGYVGLWNQYKHFFSRDKLINLWDSYLRNKAYNTKYPQYVLDDFG